MGGSFAFRIRNMAVRFFSIYFVAYFSLYPAISERIHFVFQVQLLYREPLGHPVGVDEEVFGGYFLGFIEGRRDVLYGVLFRALHVSYAVLPDFCRTTATSHGTEAKKCKIILI